MLKTLLHCAIFSATCLAMLLGTKNKKCAHALLLKLPKNCEISCWRGDTLCNGVANCCNPLRKVELSSTSCNASRNKKIARQPMLHCAILQQLVSQWHCETSCRENCSVTGPYTETHATVATGENLEVFRDISLTLFRHFYKGA